MSAAGLEQAHWDRVLSQENLGMDRGLRLGLDKLVYVPDFYESSKPFHYSLPEKISRPNPYYKKKGGQHQVSAVHTSQRKRFNKRAERAARESYFGA